MLPGLESRGAGLSNKGLIQPSRSFVIHGAALQASYVQRLVVCVFVGQSCAVCVLAMWLQVGLSQARTSKPHLSSKTNIYIAKVGIPTYARYFGMCGPRMAKISQQPGVV